MRKHILAAAIAALSLSGVAVAHEAGEVVLRAGVIHASPSTNSSKIRVGGTKVRGSSADVKSDTEFGLTATYMIMPHFGIEVLAATPFTHKVTVKGLGSAIDGKLGDVSQLPPTVSAQYYFLHPKSRFQPYAGLGLTYTMFYNEKLTREQKNNGFSNFRLDDSIGVSAQTGIDFAVTKHLTLNAAVWKMGMSTTARAKRNGERVKVDVDINPWVYFLGLGFRF